MAPLLVMIICDVQLDEITSQNKSLKSLLQCLHADPAQQDSPRLQKLLRLKNDIEERPKEPISDSSAKTLDLADVPLVSQSGKAEEGVDHFSVPFSACQLVDLHSQEPNRSQIQA